MTFNEEMKKEYGDFATKEGFSLFGDEVVVFEKVVHDSFTLLAFLVSYEFQRDGTDKKVKRYNSAYCIYNEDQVVIIDAPFRMVDVCTNFLKKKKEIHLILTHGHTDHIIDCNRFLRRFENTKIYYHKEEKYFFQWKEQERIEKVKKLASYKDALFSKLMSEEESKCLFESNILAEKELSDGDIIEFLKGVPFKIIWCPGHTPGGLSVFLKKPKKIPGEEEDEGEITESEQPKEKEKEEGEEDEGELEGERGGFLFTGDTLFCGTVGRTDLPGGNWETLESTIKKKLYSLDDEIRVFPGHPVGDDISTWCSTIGREKRENRAVKDTCIVM